MTSNAYKVEFKWVKSESLNVTSPGILPAFDIAIWCQFEKVHVTTWVSENVNLGDTNNSGKLLGTKLGLPETRQYELFWISSALDTSVRFPLDRFTLAWSKRTA